MPIKDKDIDERKIGKADDDEDQDDEDQDSNDQDTDSEDHNDDDDDDDDYDDGEDDDNVTKGLDDNKVAIIDSEVLVDALRQIIKSVMNEHFEDQKFDLSEMQDRIEGLQKSVLDHIERIDFVTKAIIDGDIVIKSVDETDEISKAAELADIEAKTTTAPKTVFVTDKSDPLSKSIGDTAQINTVSPSQLLQEAIALQSGHNIVVKGLSEFTLLKNTDTFKRLQEGVKEAKSSIAE